MFLRTIRVLEDGLCLRSARLRLEKEMEASVTEMEARSSSLMGKVYSTTDGRSYKRTGDHIILAHLYPALEREGFMDQRHLSGCFIVHNGVHGCTKQSAHVDFDMKRLRFPPSVPPLNVLVSLMDDTRLHLLNTVARQEVTVAIPKGDALVFDARVPHAGASYRYGRSHTRLFGFLPVKGMWMEDEWNNEEERRKGWLRMING